MSDLIHYATNPRTVTLMCGSTDFEDRFTFRPEAVTCPRCLEMMMEAGR